MGSKRVGLARMEALMENLKRELAMGAASLSGVNKATKSAATSATTNLEAADSGKVILVAANAAGGAMTLTGGTDKINIVAGSAKKGDQVEIICDGTSLWMATGLTSIAAALTTS